MNIFEIYKHTYVYRFSMHAHNTPPFVFVNSESPSPHSISIWLFSMACCHQANFTNVVTLEINKMVVMVWWQHTRCLLLVLFHSFILSVPCSCTCCLYCCIIFCFTFSVGLELGRYLIFRPYIRMALFVRFVPWIRYLYYYYERRRDKEHLRIKCHDKFLILKTSYRSIRVILK